MNRIQIATDARPLSGPMSGVSRVIANVIRFIPGPEKYQFHLFSHLPVHKDFQNLLRLDHVVFTQGTGVAAKKGWLWFNVSLPGLLKKMHFDLFWGPQQLACRTPANVPVVLTVHDFVAYRFASTMKMIARWQFKSMQLYSMKKADRIVAVSKQTKNEILSRFQFNPDLIDVAYSGYEPLDVSEPDPVTAPVTSDPYILCVSTLEPRKNYGMFIEAYNRYHESQVNPYSLVIAGRRGWESKEFYERLQQLQQKTGQIFILEGLRDEQIRRLYQGCAFFCMPSLYEGFGIPLLDALAQKKFSVVSDLPVFRELGEDKIEYVKANDTDAWTKALTETAAKHSTGKLKPVKFKASDWSWKNSAKIHSNAFRSVLDLSD